jgi:hypothetical protein
MSSFGREAYREYLRSDKWREIRAQRLKKDDFTCVMCGDKAKDVHHATYPSTWGTEDISSLASLCRKCHERHHELNTLAIDEDTTLLAYTVIHGTPTLHGISNSLSGIMRFCDQMEKDGVSPSDITVSCPDTYNRIIKEL